MAKIPQGILGGISGKIGGIVGSSWKGINVIKTKPLSVANPRTTAQVAQRTKFGNTVALASDILAQIIKPHWDRFASRQSGYNAFIQKNIDLFENAAPNPPQNLKISVGKMEPTPFSVGVVTEEDRDVVLTWEEALVPKFKAGNDLADDILIRRSDGKVIIGNSTAVRDDLTDTIHANEDFVPGDIWDVYLSFRRADGTVVDTNSWGYFTVAES